MTDVQKIRADAEKRFLEAIPDLVVEFPKFGDAYTAASGVREPTPLVVMYCPGGHRFAQVALYVDSRELPCLGLTMPVADGTFTNAWGNLFPEFEDPRPSRVRGPEFQRVRIRCPGGDYDQPWNQEKLLALYAAAIQQGIDTIHLP